MSFIEQCYKAVDRGLVTHEDDTHCETPVECVMDSDIQAAISVWMGFSNVNFSTHFTEGDQSYRLATYLAAGRQIRYRLTAYTVRKASERYNALQSLTEVIEEIFKTGERDNEKTAKSTGS